MADIRVGGQDFGSGVRELDFEDFDGELTDGRLTAAPHAGAGKLIAERTLSEAADEFDFQDIDQDYGDLLILGRLRLDKAATFGAVDVAINDDTTNANYLHQLTQIANASSTPSQNLGASNSRAPMLVPAANAAAGDFGQFDIEIPNYTSDSEAKDLNFRNNAKIARSSGNLLLRHGLLAWIATPAAITRLTFSPLDGGVQFVAGSSIRIFGRQASFR